MTSSEAATFCRQFIGDSGDDNGLISIEEGWCLIDYSTIRKKLFLGDIYQTALQSQSELFKFFDFSRDHIGYLPSKNSGEFEKMLKMLDKSENYDYSYNNDEIYYLIYNTSVIMFTKKDFDSTWYDVCKEMFKSVEVNDKNGKLESKEELKKEIKSIFVSYLRDCGYFHDNSEYDPMTHEKRSGEVFNTAEKLLQRMNLELFNNDESVIDEIVDYITQDIKHPFLYGLTKKSGISYIIANRFAQLIGTIIISSRLVHLAGNDDDMDESDSKKDVSKDVIVPIKNNAHKDSMVHISKFIWDLSIYNICSSPDRDMDVSESYFIGNYLKWSEKCIYNESDPLLILKKCGVFHFAAEKDLQFYCKLLLQHGWNPMIKDKGGFNVFQKVKYAPQTKTLLEGYKAKFANSSDDSKTNNEEDEILNAESMKASEMETTYFKLKQQIAFSQRLLLYLGCTPSNIESYMHRQVTHEALNAVNDEAYFDGAASANHRQMMQQALGPMFAMMNGGNTKLKDNQRMKDFQDETLFKDDLYKCLNDCTAIKREKSVCKTSKDAEHTMEAIVEDMMQLLKDRSPISDDMLIACYYYCYCNNDKLKHEFITLLQDIGKECLDDGSLFDYTWFKEYLANSNIWLMFSDSNNTLLYDAIETTVDKAMYKQQEIIYNSVKNEEKTDSDKWDKLLNFSEINCKPNLLRQDRIKMNGKLVGIVPEWKEAQLWEATVASSTMAASGSHRARSRQTKTTSNYDMFQEYNSKIYLTKLLILSNKMNIYFQSDMSKLFNEKIGDVLSDGTLHFQSAPVKLFERCVVKSQTGMFVFLYLFFLCVSPLCTFACLW